MPRGTKLDSKQLLGDFVIEGSEGQKYLSQWLTVPVERIRLRTLIRAIKTVSVFMNTTVPKPYTRLKGLVIKWVDMNVVEFEQAVTTYQLQAVLSGQ